MSKELEALKDLRENCENITFTQTAINNKNYETVKLALEALEIMTNKFGVKELFYKYEDNFKQDLAENEFNKLKEYLGERE